MKNIVSRRYTRAILPILLMAVLFTFPSVVTESKYEWENTINVELTVLYPSTSITSLLHDGYPSEFWLQELTNIQATATEDGLVLTAADGYTLPECITVKIEETEYSVSTNGQSNPEGIIFDSGSGTLIISDAILADSQRPVTIIANALSSQDQAGSSEQTNGSSFSSVE